ncbi:sigma-54 dependent transcriptional regulator [Thioalkalivibrio sp. XN279]|uniref:sigma-54-dependent transcriptional regulator n=1 Tax=Thioalkalivibrio sp. XN279 TaxID=2714953 RepID=UPI00140B6104|nr:sigma-54 dependent transcriptional regulator [Thioalkalivibrio sp. XN279]NHA14767.1 sigma-54-dependent Fis family transcriptional regulator [Thioalkalivibrio sp. XN279]
MLQALIYCDDAETVVPLSDTFREAGYAVQVATTLKDLRGALLRDPPDMALVDYDILEPDTMEFLASGQLGRIVKLLLMTDDPRLSSAVRGMHLGAADYLAKPIDPARLHQALGRIKAAVTQPDPSATEDILLAERHGMQGESRPMQRLFRLLRKVGPTDMTVLLCGESGVGKELAAQAIHGFSKRREGPLVPVNCGAISPDILESELFGHEKGSFTGASSKHVGFFERAEGGTLFLDEITEMSPPLQVKLLRVLESAGIRRVGGEQEIPIDTRVVAATNRDPDEAVHDGTLREDLYYRLAQFPIRIPALRERGEDIGLLADTFLAAMNAANGTAKSLSDEALELLRLHEWPGNVRELKNTMARAFVLADDSIRPDDLPARIIDPDPNQGDYLRVRVGQPLAEVERRTILATVSHFGDDRKAAAEALGISRRTLYSKLKKYRSS